MPADREMAGDPGFPQLPCDAAELRQLALQLGAHSYVVKSAPPEDLLAEVKKLLGQTK